MRQVILAYVGTKSTTTITDERRVENRFSPKFSEATKSEDQSKSDSWIWLGYPVFRIQGKEQHPTYRFIQVALQLTTAFHNDLQAFISGWETLVRKEIFKYFEYFSSSLSLARRIVLLSCVFTAEVNKVLYSKTTIMIIIISTCSSKRLKHNDATHDNRDNDFLQLTSSQDVIFPLHYKGCPSKLFTPKEHLAFGRQTSLTISLSYFVSF